MSRSHRSRWRAKRRVSRDPGILVGLAYRPAGVPVDPASTAAASSVAGASADPVNRLDSWLRRLDEERPTAD